MYIIPFDIFFFKCKLTQCNKHISSILLLIYYRCKYLSTPRWQMIPDICTFRIWKPFNTQVCFLYVIIDWCSDTIYLLKVLGSYLQVSFWLILCGKNHFNKCFTSFTINRNRKRHRFLNLLSQSIFTLSWTVVFMLKPTEERATILYRQHFSD